MKNYHEILGVKEGASREEITSRWIELRKEFQLNPRKDDEALKTIKEINEAYEILKNSAPRVEFDADKILRKVILSRRAERKKKRKKIITSSGILAISLIIGASIFILKRPQVTTQLASTTQDDPNRKPQRSIKETAPLPPLESQTPLRIKVIPQEPGKTVMPEIAKPVPVAPPALKPGPPVEVAKVVPQEPSKKVVPEAVRPVPVAPPALKPGPPVEVAEVVPQEPSKKVVPEAVRPVPVAPPALKPGPPVEVAKEIPQEPSKITVPTPPSGLASETEVRQFFRSYSSSYNNKSIEDFISFFSAKAIQNQKDNLEKIRKTYETFFDLMETVQYRISIDKIEPQQNTVEVRGQYQIEGVVSKGRKKQTWKGQIRWVLVRENGPLKILSLDYKLEHHSISET